MLWPSTSFGASTLRFQERLPWWPRSRSVFRGSSLSYHILVFTCTSRRKSSRLRICHSLIIAVAFRLANFNEAGRATNPFLLEELFIVWTQTELNYSIISATVPTLRPFVNNLNTQLGGLGPTDSNGYGYGYGSGSRSRVQASGNYQLSKMKSVDKGHIRDESTTTQPAGGFTGQPHAYSYGIWVPRTSVDATKSHGGGGGGGGRRNTGSGDATSVNSNDSRQMIITKDVTWEVHHEHDPEP